VLDGEVVVAQVDGDVGVDQPVLDELPDDPGHLVAVELDDRTLTLDLRHGTRLLRRARSLGAAYRPAARPQRAPSARPLLADHAIPVDE
jgi:hypothetical protein